MEGEPKTLHIWMPNGRSLCDRRAERYELPDDATPEEVQADHQEATTAPGCGACLVIAFFIRGEAAKLFESSKTIWPETVAEAWHSMRGTAWDGPLPLLSQNWVEATGQVVQGFDLFTEHLNVETVGGEVARDKKKRQSRYQARLRRARKLHAKPADD